MQIGVRQDFVDGTGILYIDKPSNRLTRKAIRDAFANLLSSGRRACQRAIYLCRPQRGAPLSASGTPFQVNLQAPGALPRNTVPVPAMVQSSVAQRAPRAGGGCLCPTAKLAGSGVPGL